METIQKAKYHGQNEYNDKSWGYHRLVGHLRSMGVDKASDYWPF
jgi:hypothetical protein